MYFGCAHLIDSDIELTSVHGLNLVVPEDAKAIVKPWSDRNDSEKYAESNVDDQVRIHDSSTDPGRLTSRLDLQLIIHIPFTERVRIRSVLLKLGMCDQIDRGTPSRFTVLKAGEITRLDIYGYTPIIPT